ncbi:transposase [Rhodococcus qingshengii]|uniref:Transposase n=1 Tax=Rhodococcus qingshengii TaxID=334542 RepID=A0A2A5J0E9_RHOSG|nr:transposase [Rhodococcus qingshengii]PCK22717.1 hypothetical protein CHR55_31565 [Rhodococcus qingshengii]
MSRKRRSFTPEYKVEAAHRVIDSGRTIADVARVNWASTKPSSDAGSPTNDDASMLLQSPAINR